MFLTDEQLVILTGRKRRAGQIAWLAEHRIPHMVSASGHPVVAQKEIERRLTSDPKFRSKDRPKLELVR